MVSRRKLRQQTERNSQNAKAALANFKPAAPATPSYPNLGNRIGQQPQGLSLSERDEMRTKLNNTNGKKMIQDTNAKFRGANSFTGSFNSAFAAARKQGLKQFQWNGKLYGTQLASNPKPTQVTQTPKQVTQNIEPVQEGTYEDSMRRGVLPEVSVVANKFPPKYTDWRESTQAPYSNKVVGRTEVTGSSLTGPALYTESNITNSPGSNPIYETNRPDIIHMGTHNWGQMQFNGRSSPQVDAARERLMRQNSNPNQIGKIQWSRETNDMAENARRGVGDWLYSRLPKREKGGKLGDKQQEFVAYLIQASGVETEDELNDYIQDLGQDGLQRELAKFEELMTQGTEQVPAAAKGAKLNYIKSLRGQCPEGFEMQYFKKGGVMCSQCIKKAKAQKAPTKAEQGTKVVQDFKADMKKCGGKMKGKMKKKEEGGKVKTIPGVIDTKENKLSPKGKVQIKKHYFGGKL